MIDAPFSDPSTSLRTSPSTSLRTSLQSRISQPFDCPFAPLRASAKGRLPTWLWALLIFAVALVPRALAVGGYVTPDEPNWVYRTLNFGAALARGDWAATAQTSHPGVTTMWLGSLGIAAQRAVDPAGTADAIYWLSKIDRLSPENLEALRRIGVFLDWARLPVIVVNALGVVGVFLLAGRLFNRASARLAAFLLALDPFTAGLQGLLHVDGLMTTFSTLSLLSLLLATRSLQHETHESSSSPLVARHSLFAVRRSPFFWFGAFGAFAGLALLSKSPAIFLMPFGALALLVALVARRLSTRDAIIGCTFFFILHSTLFIALYPATWSDASSALGRMFEGVVYHTATATRPTFFDGQAELDHGIEFYPITLSYRLSPVVMLGLFLAAILLFTRNRRDSRTLIFTLLLFAISFIVFLTPAAKKFDRYVLPAIPPLIIAAAWGISQLTDKPTSRLSRLLSPAAIFLQAILLLSVIPYPLMAYNALLGGATGARDRIAIGWGEGLVAAARWVAERQPDATIAIGGLPNLAPLYAGRIATLNDAGLAAADHIIFTVSEVQQAPDFFASLAQRGTLVHTIRSGGIDTTWVYRNDRHAEQAAWIRHRAGPRDAILLDAPTPLAHLLDPLPARILPPNVTPEGISSTMDTLHEYEHILYISTAAATPVVRRDVRAWLDANARPESETPLPGATARVYAPKNQTSTSLSPFVAQFDGSLALLGLEMLTDTAAYPESIVVAARWLTLAPPATDYAASFEVSDAGGDGWVRIGGPLRNASDFAPTEWKPGEVIEQAFSAQVPPWLAPGSYRLRFSADRADGSRAGLVDASGAFTGAAPVLASITIEPSRQFANPADILTDQRIEHAWPGRVELIGAAILSYVPSTGDLFFATMYWRALRDGLDPGMELRWSLRPTFTTDVPPLEWQTPLAPHTPARLRAGDIVAARYAVRLPLGLPDGRYHLRLSIDGETLDVATNIDISHVERAFDLPPGAAAVGSLGTFDVYRTRPLPAHLKPGESLQVNLGIRARAEVLVAYSVSVRLIAPGGQTVAQSDSWPQQGAWPTTNWVRHQVVEDTHTMTLPSDAPPGVYRVAISMYDSLDGSALPARDADGRAAPDRRLTLGTLQVSVP
ncbi:MAG TPA: glycosyltransferase family 39 protein [Anaerolineae bacterium]|nr:glycosyltransferase family 39 protein [Anaerolineae bacterium]